MSAPHQNQFFEGLATGDVAAKFGDEAGRLAALARYDVLDTPPEAGFEEITVLVKSIFGTPMVAISMVDLDRQWFKASQGLDAPEMPRDVAFCHYTISGDACMAVTDATLDPRFAANPLVTGAPSIRSYLGAPLTTPEGYNVGSLCVIDTAPRVFTTEEETLLTNFAKLVVAQLELRQIASRDGLTGVLTRRAFEEETQRELARHARHGMAASLGVFDLDHFKGVNDTWGHAVGDAVLRRTVAACTQVLRESDRIGRIGGEEFGVLIVGASSADAARILERLRAAVEAAVVPEHPQVRFTSSFGAAACTLAFKSAADWMAAADACLYAAKRAGRNCCVVAPARLPATGPAVQARAGGAAAR